MTYCLFLQVYVGREDCKTIYVNDCILKEVPNIIKVEKPHCSITGKIPYMTIEPITEIKIGYKMECKVNNCMIQLCRLEMAPLLNNYY